MAANVASGVGFLGAGVITTQGKDSKENTNHNIVHGLTTAAAIWLSAAVGVASAVGMYLTAGTTTLLTVAILRLGKGDNESSKRNSKDFEELDQYRVEKNAASYHPSDTHDTSDWDELHEVQAPGPVGDSMSEFIRNQKTLPSDWISMRFQNETVYVPETAIQEWQLQSSQNSTSTDTNLDP